MRDNRPYGPEGGEFQHNETSLPLSLIARGGRWAEVDGGVMERLLGFKDIRTAMLYLHGNNKPGLAVRSPVMTFRGGEGRRNLKLQI